jgi:radical SAM protein with 4Fe4S-binding SPASM domain
MRIIKSESIKTISCGNNIYVLYNTLLNIPIVLDEKCIEFIDKNNFFDIDKNNFSEDESALLDALQESFIYLPENIKEQYICESENNKYLEKLTNGKTVKYLDLRVSEKCNFGCSHCISGKAQKGSVMTLELALQSVDYVVNFLKKNQTDFSKLDLHYGNAEPLLNFSVIKAVQKHFKEYYPNIDKVVSINTNLSILSENMAEFLINEGILIYVSLDGLKEANDSIRVWKNGEGTFDLIISKMNMLADKGYPIEGISVTVTDKNYKYFDLSFVDWCYEQGYKSLAMDFDLVNPLQVSVKDRVNFLAGMWKKAKEVGLEFFGTWITPFLNISNRSITKEHYAFCKGIHGQSLSVSSDGMIYVCGSSSNSLCHYTELESAINNGGKIHNLIKSRLIGNNEMCKGCMIEGACAGQCQVTLEYDHKKIVDQCNFYRLVTSELLKEQAIMDML